MGHLRQCKTHVYLLDLSPDLLRMARQRFKALGLEGQATFICADVIKAFPAKGQGQGQAPTASLQLINVDGEAVQGRVPESFDMVTCSFCLTMIPPWREVLEAMVRAVRPGGTLALIDFTVRSDTPAAWGQRLNKWWFAHDGVYFDEAQPAALRSHPDLTTVWYHEAEARVPYTPLEATHYLWTGVKHLNA